MATYLDILYDIIYQSMTMYLGVCPVHGGGVEGVINL